MYRFTKIAKVCSIRKFSKSIEFNFLNLKDINFNIDLYEYFKLPPEERNNYGKEKKINE